MATASEVPVRAAVPAAEPVDAGRDVTGPAIHILLARADRPGEGTLVNGDEPGPA